MKAKAEGASVDWIAWAKSLILFGMGIYLALLILTGKLDNYINQRFAWLAYVGAAIFVLLALVNLYGSLRSPARDHDHHHDHDHDHHHDHHNDHHHYHIGWDILLIAAFPLLLALLIPSRALGVEAVNGGVSLSPVGVAVEGAFRRDPLDRNILDWLREFDRAATPAAFNGVPVDVIGFVYREPRFPAGGFMLSRFTLSCCVADAFPIGMPVIAEEADAIEAGAWLRLRGKIEASEFDGAFLPVVYPSAIDLVGEPEQPYLYP